MYCVSLHWFANEQIWLLLSLTPFKLCFQKVWMIIRLICVSILCFYLGNEFQNGKHFVILDLNDGDKNLTMFALLRDLHRCFKVMMEDTFSCIVLSR